MLLRRAPSTSAAHTCVRARILVCVAHLSVTRAAVAATVYILDLDQLLIAGVFTAGIVYPPIQGQHGSS